jgi:trimethylamine---corrinoid protein Co-methyltransferase
MQTLGREGIHRLHDAAMEILATVGVRFDEAEALDLFRHGGFRVDGTTVYLTEERVQKALQTAPAQFTIKARRRDKCVTLAQLANPGAPVIYGGLSSAVDMRTGGLTVGCPELSRLAAATAQLARLYGLPSRSAGSLTDAHVADAQAAGESALALSTAVRNGIHFILDAAGILGAYMAMSYEKFLIDEEICGLLRELSAPIEIGDEAIDVEMIKAVGIGGQYLTHPETLQRCRTEFFTPSLFTRGNHEGWCRAGARRIDQVADEEIDRRLTSYQKPAIDPEVEAALSAYVAEHKGGG